MDLDLELSRAVITLFNDQTGGGEFYAHLLSQTDKQFSDAIPRACVTIGRSLQLLINPDFFTKTLIEGTESGSLEARKRQANLLSHEVLHVALDHLLVYSNYANKKLFNIAADLVVNSCLDKKYLPMGLFPEDFGLPKDKDLGWYYSNFPKEKYPECLCDSGGEADPDNPTRCKDCGGLRPLDVHDWEGLRDDSLTKSIIKDALLRAADSTTAGNIHSALQEIIATLREPPQLPWTTIVKRFTAKITRGGLTYTKKKLSKRFGSRPAIKIATKRKLAVLPDVSGSVSNEEYLEFFTEIFGIAKNTEVTVIEWDTEVCSVRSIKGYEPKITRTGSGGTDPTAAINYLQDNRSKFDGAIFFTDGGLFLDIEQKLPVPSLWVLTAGGTDQNLRKQTITRLKK